MAFDTLRYGDVTELLSQPLTSSLPGAIFALPPAANVITWCHVETGSPSTISISILGSLDGINFLLLDSDSAIAGAIKTITFNAVRFIRANFNSRTGGTLTRVLVCIGK